MRIIRVLQAPTRATTFPHRRLIDSFSASFYCAFTLNDSSLFANVNFVPLVDMSSERDLVSLRFNQLLL